MWVDVCLTPQVHTWGMRPLHCFQSGGGVCSSLVACLGETEAIVDMAGLWNWIPCLHTFERLCPWTAHTLWGWQVIQYD